MLGMLKISPSRAGTLALVTTVLCWATAFPAIRAGLKGFSPLALGLCRLLVASLALGGIAALRGIAVPPRTWWPRAILAGLIGQTLNQGLLMTGEMTVPGGTAGLLIATAPLFSISIAALVLHEPVRHAIPGMTWHSLERHSSAPRWGWVAARECSSSLLQPHVKAPITSL